MGYEWDEAKRLKNIASKRLDFIRASLVFDGRRVLTLRSKYPDEERYISIALFDDGKFYAVIWTWRDGNQRIISFRRAHNGEERQYRQIYA